MTVPPWRPVPAPPNPPHPVPAPPPQPPLPEPGRPSMPFVPLPPDLGLPSDVLDRLLERRLVLVTGFLDQSLATRTAAQVMLLDADREEPIQLHLSCSDGDLDASIMLAETVDLLRVPVVAIAGGMVGGPAVAVYASAGRRLAQPHSAFGLREPRVQLEGTADQLAGRVAQHRHQLAYLREHLARACGQPVETVAADLEAGRFLPAPEAVGYGLVHELVSRAASARPA